MIQFVEKLNELDTTGVETFIAHERQHQCIERRRSKRKPLRVKKV